MIADFHDTMPLRSAREQAETLGLGVRSLFSTKCNQNCVQGRACTCEADVEIEEKREPMSDGARMAVVCILLVSAICVVAACVAIVARL